MRYRGANIRLLKEPALADIKTVLTGIRAQGGNALAINTIHKVYLNGTDLTPPPIDWHPWTLIYPDVGQDPAHPFGDTVSIDLVDACVEMAIGMGFERVLIKPMIDSDYAQWRGFINIPDDLRLAWSAAYKTRLLAPYLPLVKEFGLDLCIGTELYTVTKKLGAPFWLDVVQWLRQQGVTQRLTYAANWGWEADAEYNRLRPLWDVLDYIGIDAYWPMVPEGYTGPITTDLLVNGAAQNIGWSRRLADDSGTPYSWCPPIDADLQRLVQETGKPLWFTEIGYPNNETAAVDPAGDTAGNVPGFQVSQPCWEAAREKWDTVLEGWLAWEAGSGSVVSTTHNILGGQLGAIAWGVR